MGWVPTTGYMSLQQAKVDMSSYLMGYYNYQRPILLILVCHELLLKKNLIPSPEPADHYNALL
jgi:hypothetical protein